MNLIARPFAGDSDFPLIAELIRTTPSSSRHRVDFPWRLSSPALQSDLDARLWLTRDDLLVGFAAWQRWWAANLVMTWSAYVGRIDGRPN